MAWVRRGLNSPRVHFALLSASTKNMAENKHVDLIQAGLEDLAKITGKSVEELAQKSLEESNKLEESEDLAVKESARDHARMTKKAIKKIRSKKTDHYF